MVMTETKMVAVGVGRDGWIGDTGGSAGAIC